MTDATWPRLKLGGHLLPGVAAVALFGVLALVIAGSSFGSPAGFPTDAEITAGIGYAMFDLARGDVAAEGFLAAFEIVDVVLVAALAAAVMLARTETDGSLVAALTDGGRDTTTENAADDEVTRSGVNGNTADETGGDR